MADVRWEMATGEIRTSLFGAADAAGLPDAITMQLADVFAGDIDFYKDIKRGDRFAVVYEMRDLDGEPIGSGRIVAARFENRGRTLEAYLWRDAGGSEGYYTSAGVPLQRAFLRSPLAFSRITSGFSLARFHPILHTWRAHKGVDYAAPIGTPVRATANGTVILAGRQGGYGNVIHIRNQGQYSTLYAHLSAFAKGMKAGVRVMQGEVIGYVGQTGWATGPHLHYEFRVANVQRDPLAVALPAAEPLPPSLRAAFRAGIAPVETELALISARSDVLRQRRLSRRPFPSHRATRALRWRDVGHEPRRRRRHRRRFRARAGPARASSSPPCTCRSRRRCAPSCSRCSARDR